MNLNDLELKRSLGEIDDKQFARLKNHFDGFKDFGYTKLDSTQKVAALLPFGKNYRARIRLAEIRLQKEYKALDNSLTKFRFDKWAFGISIASFLVAAYVAFIKPNKSEEKIEELKPDKYMLKSEAETQKIDIKTLQLNFDSMKRDLIKIQNDSH